MRCFAISLVAIALAAACSEPIEGEPIVGPPPGPGMQPPIESDPDSEAHTRLYPAACSEETITAAHRDTLLRTFAGDQITSEERFRDDQALATIHFTSSPTSSERTTLQHQVAMRYRTLEVLDSSGQLVQRQKLRGPIDSSPQEDECLSIETHKYPEPGKHIIELDDDCNGVDGTVTRTRTGDSEVVIRDDDGDGISELVTFNFFDEDGEQTRRVDLLSSTESREWNWVRTGDEDTEVLEYYQGAVGDTLLKRTETLRAEDGTVRSQSEYLALGALTISRSFDDFGNRLTEVTRNADGDQVSIKTFGYDCFAPGE